MKIALIRHGVTNWNKEKRMQGKSDIPLNDEGIRQAQCLGDSPLKEKWDVLYSSDLIRAYKTAEIIAGDEKDRIIVDARLQEVGRGLIEGTTEDDRIRKWGENWPNMDLELESMEDVCLRRDAVLSEIMNQHAGKNVWIVSHGSFIKAILRKLVPEADVEQSLGNVSVTIVEYIEGNWQLITHNNTTHLHVEQK